MQRTRQKRGTVLVPPDSAESGFPVESGDGAEAGHSKFPKDVAPAKRTGGTGEPPVVGIGASSGGLASFIRLLGQLPAESGLAYVLLQHLDPAQESLLPEILTRAGKIPVVAALDGVLVEANHAYVIPPNTSMTVTDGHLRVVKAEKRRGPSTVIDVFFRSLAAVHRNEAVGIILSGAGSDGASGIEAIKEYGGITLAEDPASAQYPGMPDSAIATGCIDFVMSPEEIAEQLKLIGKHLAVRPGAGDDDSDVHKILAMLRSRTGADFSGYRRATVHRRILRRMLAHRNGSHAEYLTHLRARPEDLDELYEDLLIGVTRFFRDPETFAALSETAFPEMMKDRPADAPIRVWVAGCSTGEEAYSLAIVLLEFLEAYGASETRIELFATDLNENAIVRARAGFYSPAIEASVSAERLSRYFVKEAGGYRVTRRLRDLCVFAMQNIVRDPPFSQLDLISCRNVLIYFEQELQERVMPMFNYALKPHGLLVLGNAESVGNSTDYFTPLDRRHKIYRSQASPRRVADLDRIAGLLPTPRAQLVKRGKSILSRADSVREDADRAVMTRFAPPGVVINERLEITQFRGDTTGFVQPTSGVASLHLFKFVRAELVTPLRTAIDAARSSQAPVRNEGVRLRDGAVTRRIAIEVIPFPSRAAREPFFLILFDRMTPPATAARTSKAAARKGKKTANRIEADTLEHGELRALRDELAEAQRYLQDVVEQYEGANEELRAANEEIQSGNEELQSTNEELETTKEEVQSTNQELTTVNEELRHRNRELAATSADLSNFFASTRIPIVIVDGKLILRRFTPVSDQVITIKAADVGRPLSDLRLRVALPDLEVRVASVIGTQEPSEVDVVDDQGRWWALTIRPCVTVDGQNDGAVLAFTDIDASKKFGKQAEEGSENRRLLLLEADGARAEATAANRAKSSFLANISHDLRTPLNAIAGYSDLLQLLVHGPLTPDQESDVARIKRSARYLLSLINDLLNFSKVDGGSLDLRIEDVAVDGAVEAIEEMLHPLLDEKGLTFEPCHTGAVVRADPDKVQQVLLNLASNAIKFTPFGGISVTCSTTQSLVTISVADTGVGIAEAQLQRIFEPFIQVNRSLTNVNHEGVGLGLSISRELARAMGGDITVASVLGEGSTFSLALPRAPAVS